MAKSSDYKTLSKGIAAQWVRAMLIGDAIQRDRLYWVLTDAITKARKLEEEEIKARAG